MIRGIDLKFDLINVGSRISLNSVIRVKNNSQKEFVVIEFNSNELDKTFIKDVFYDKNKNVYAVHPLLSRGVELLLSKGKLRVVLHSGVTLILKNDMPFHPEYKTFTNEELVGRVVAVNGEVVDSKIEIANMEKFKDYFISYQASKSYNQAGTSQILPDGSTITYFPPLTDDVLPNKYQPKIVAD